MAMQPNVSRPAPVAPIVRQFLVETTMITVTGGFVGTVVGIGLSQLVAYFAGWSTIVSVTSVAQLDDIAGAAALKLDAASLRRLDEASKP